MHQSAVTVTRQIDERPQRVLCGRRQDHEDVPGCCIGVIPRSGGPSSPPFLNLRRWTEAIKQPELSVELRVWRKETVRPRGSATDQFAPVSAAAPVCRERAGHVGRAWTSAAVLEVGEIDQEGGAEENGL